MGNNLKMPYGWDSGSIFFFVSLLLSIIFNPILAKFKSSKAFCHLNIEEKRSIVYSVGSRVSFMSFSRRIQYVFVDKLVIKRSDTAASANTRKWLGRPVNIKTTTTKKTG